MADNSRIGTYRYNFIVTYDTKYHCILDKHWLLTLDISGERYYLLYLQPVLTKFLLDYVIFPTSILSQKIVPLYGLI